MKMIGVLLGVIAFAMTAFIVIAFTFRIGGPAASDLLKVVTWCAVGVFALAKALMWYSDKKHLG